MKINEVLIKPLNEANYLNVENTDRYRPIMRVFYEKYKKMKYDLYKEEVYNELVENDYFKGYTIKMCESDLENLVYWNNLTTTQDTGKSFTIEEFKNKKFRYQMTRPSVEIERMIEKIENLYIETSSLETGLLERIRINIKKSEKIINETDEDINQWWHDLNSDFERLNRNYQDYLKELSSSQYENLINADGFLIYKDKITNYLRNFVRSLQIHVNYIEDYLKNQNTDIMAQIIEKITNYKSELPRKEKYFDRKYSYEIDMGKWENIKRWFTGSLGEQSEAGRVFDTTNNVIHQITTYALRLTELRNIGANRKLEYRHLAKLFDSLENMEEAHKLSACVFGVEKPLNLTVNLERKTESINSSVYDEESCKIKIKPRIRTFREKGKRLPIIDRSEEKEKRKKEVLNKRLMQNRMIKKYIKGNVLDFSTLPVIEKQIRDIFLLWISRAFESKSCNGKTEEGKDYVIENPDTKKRCILRSTDGDMDMPAFKIIFKR